MAFFKFRKSSPSRQDTPGAGGDTAAPAETVESLRRRALYRLIGAAVLVLIAIIGFPMLFDTQPRQAAVQAPIIIPSRNAAPPLTAPTSAAIGPAPSASSRMPATASLAAEGKVVTAPGDGSASGAMAPAASSAASTPRSAPDARARQQAARQPTAGQPPASPAAQRAAEKRKANEQAQRQRNQAAEAARARTLLDDQNAAPPASSASHEANAHTQEGRYAIQIGAFATAQAAQTARQKVEHIGVKTYTQTVGTGAGQRTRVRIGPFANRDEAERALAKLKQAGLTGGIVSP